MRTLRFSVLLVLLGASACNRYRVRDDVDLTFDFAPLVGPSNLLHQPYVQGSSMRVFFDALDAKDRVDGWSVRSADPTVFSVDAPSVEIYDHNTLSVRGHALEAGTARLELLNAKGSVVHRASVEIAAPDRVELLAHGPMLVGRDELDPKTLDPRVLQFGTATFLCRYYRGSELLFGNGALAVDAPQDVVASTPTTFLFEDRDWLQVSPQRIGDFTIPLRVGGDIATQVTLHAVASSDIASLHIYGEDESHAHRGQWLVALAQAFDQSGRPVYGVEYNWDVDGDNAIGTGDLYRYEYEPAKKHSLGAHYSGLSATATIHGENGFVDSSNNLGCQSTPGAPSLFAGVVVALFFVRRSRHNLT